MMNKGRGALIFLMNVAGIVVVTIILAPLVMPIVEFLLPLIPGLPRLLGTHTYPEGYDYAKVWYNILQFVTMGFLVFNVRRLGFTSLSSIGLPFQPGWRLLLWQGFFWAIIGYMIIIGVSVLVGARYIELHKSGWPLLRDIGELLVVGSAVGLLKEIMFRGMIFQVVERWIGTVGSVVVTSSLFSFYHFLFKARVPVKLGVIDWGVGLRGLQEHLWTLVNPGETYVVQFLSFFLIGVVLNYTFIRIGSLYFPIGLHAAWNFMDKGDDLFMSKGGLRGWLFGADGVGPALFGWVAMMLFLYYVAVRYRSQRIHDARSTP